MVGYKRITYLWAHLKLIRPDGRPQPGNKPVCGHFHSGDQVFQNPTTQTTPTGMGSANKASCLITQNHRQAVCTENSACQTRLASKTGIGFRVIIYILMSNLRHIDTMHLPEPGYISLLKPRYLSQQCPIFPDIFCAVIHMVAQIQGVPRRTTHTTCAGGGKRCHFARSRPLWLDQG